MPSRTEHLRTARKEANDRVRVAEERVGAAWTDFAAGRSGPPDRELLTEVQRLRRECDERLSALLDEFAGQAPDDGQDA